jgi:methionyl-tRNA formyltransferase
VREIAGEHDVPIFDPEDINCESSRARLLAYGADLLVVCDYGQILSRATLATARLGGVNAHGSLLPKYRGAAPVQWAIYHGEAETGVSVIHMTPELDAGPVVAQDRTPIDPDETAEQLERRLAEMAGRLVSEVVDSLESGRLAELPQDAAQASRAPRLKKSDGLIDWSRTAGRIKNQVRAMQPWPKAFTYWRRPSGPPLRLIVGSVSAVAGAPPPAPPGVVLEAGENRLAVAAGEGVVDVQEVQPAGKRMLPAAEFLRGYQVKPGDQFGAE